jgi:hypothetical protein
MSNTICPYPGLRPFNEEESIFFKGREQQVERLVKRLEEKKFLMVNGASGDGKSSLIYAGVIPFAKAGFFKAKYNNWIVADFRPERSPLKNITASICKQLNIEDVSKTEKELGYGFSALCDLYKASSFYVDETKPTWQLADEKERKALKRKGANLLVLVDQFEEFFTNPENYQNGIPSIESQKTINLLIETYKLASAQDLPIYVVCTMRSDYIGQCAAFRGLPESIGYSQFFVPRLKRQEIEQVIEGPAELAGCRISKRLTQTLLNSITEGFDQLPILQHALNHVWKMANNGQEEMDLIHLAKVGGLSPKFLNGEGQQKFETWRNALPSFKKQLLEKPSLSNVLNAHANELYLTAHAIYEEKYGRPISEEQSKKIIKGVFQCLTKIDASRAVRNRMTLQEITNIINDEKINVEKVDQLLQIYREQGNTFLQPFIGEHGENSKLEPNTVLDITHESLIRNWTQLTNWANEEYENLQNYLDFDKQLKRWINADFSSGYLLPIGPLTFFEHWYEKLNPSKFWINRYEEFEGNLEQQLEQANNKLFQAKDFLHKSAQRLIFSRTVLKYGAQRIAIIAGVILLIGLCTYYYFDYRKKQNDYVLNELRNHAKEMLFSSNVSIEAKADFLINNDRLNELKNQKYEFEIQLNALNNDTLAFDICGAMINNCLTHVDSTNYDKNGIYTFMLFEYLFKNFEIAISNKIDAIGKQHKIHLSKNSTNRLNNFLGICARLKYDDILNKKAELDTIINRTIFKTQWYMSEAIKSKSYQKQLVAQDMLYTFSALIAIDDSPNYSEFIHLLSPLEDDLEAKARFDSIFKRNEVYKFNCEDLVKQGGFHLLALLYATQFKSDITAKSKITALIDSNSINHKYNLTDIYLTLIKYNGNDKYDYSFVVNKYADNDWKKAQFVGNSIQHLFDGLDIKSNFPSSFIKSFIPVTSAISLFDNAEKILLNTTFNDSTKMNLAVYYKKRGFYYANYIKDNTQAEMYFNAAINYYCAVDEVHKNTMHYFDKLDWNGYGVYNAYWFLYPGVISEYVVVFNDCHSTSIGFTKLPKNEFYSPFLTYLLNNKKSNLYNSSIALNAFSDNISYSKDACTNTCMQLLNNLMSENTDIITNTDLAACIQLYRVNQYFTYGKINKANALLDSVIRIMPKDLHIANSWIESNALWLALRGDTARSLRLLNLVKTAPEKNRMLLKICYELQKGEGIENTFLYLNELFKSNSYDNKIGMSLYRVLGKIGGVAIERLTKQKYRNTAELIKPKALNNWVTGTAENGNYYKAKKLIPENVSETKELILINQILKTDIIDKSKKLSENAWKGNWNDGRYFDLDLGENSYSNDFQFNSLD